MGLNDFSIVTLHALDIDGEQEVGFGSRHFDSRGPNCYAMLLHDNSPPVIWSSTPEFLCCK